ncbi:hypothetical protein ACOACO_03085 [Nocardioides sp. CPCC 205120]|uniref:hypothetical protein n=1 Tax=Nocardioides sp. CPCC 205120 TaxID=3406462 RepID=UPI003B5102E9
MKTLLAVLSGLCFVVAAVVLALAFGQLNSDLDAETQQKCVTPAPPPEGTVTQRCTGTDESGGQVTLVVTGGSLLVAGSVLALAAVNVRRRDERPAPVPGPGGAPWNPPGR